MTSFIKFCTSLTYTLYTKVFSYLAYFSVHSLAV